MMKYGSVCSGVEAATAAWHPLGWTPQWFSEIEKFPSAVLAHHYPDVPNLGDMTKFKEWPIDRSIDLLVGGTPCQSFSVAGLRKDLMTQGEISCSPILPSLHNISPSGWFGRTSPASCLANEDGILEPSSGRWASSGMGSPTECLTLSISEWPSAASVCSLSDTLETGDVAAVLFERESMSGHPAPSREAGQKAAPTVTQGAPFSRTGNERVEAEAIVAQCLTTRTGSAYDPTTETLPIAFGAQNSANQGDSVSTEVTPTLDKSKTPAVAMSSAVRRLTPIECERLQGFPDGFTRIPWRNKSADDCPDGPRYKAMGNSMAVPVMRWIGERIDAVENIL